ncbi:hypothetical protein MKK69_04550 [Methylobacterium sp. J-026]|uniref:hypothetical protein n=1 Tax=Methylobacterium sp. J-026 TaxID=2836624 RepID=UPI001FBA885D|nr:hypothetical protein [Methylobacterium sp. J-026]MCJ2133338.1 hypothetical protein [Methylobacterium sp. J-026]
MTDPNPFHGRDYEVRAATASEKLAWPLPFDSMHPHLRTIVRRKDGATFTIACQTPDAFGDYSDEEIAAQFEAELDAAIGEPLF